MQNPTILVTGATGTIGSHLVPLLDEAGTHVIAGSRSGQSRDGVPARVVDFEDPASLRRAFEGIDSLFLLFPLVPNKLELARHAIDAARDAGVRHIVRSSGAGADPQSPSTIGRLQGSIDELVMNSGIAWTIVRPSFFAQNWITYHGEMIRKGEVFLSYGDGKAGYVDALDIAAVSARVLLDPEAHAGAIHTLTGPAALGVQEVLDEIARASGRVATYRRIAESDAIAAMQTMGMDAWTTDILSGLNQAIAAGYAAGLTDDVQKITGRPARSFATFAEQNADRWR